MEHPMDHSSLIISAVPDIEVVQKWNGIRKDILRIEHACYEESLRYSEEEFLEDLHDNDARFFVLRAGGRIQGCGNVAPLHRLDYCAFDPHFLLEDTLYVVGIAVAPEYRNRGYASLMLLQVMERGGYSRFSAHAVGSVSKSMFIGSGFREEGMFPGWMGGHDAVYLVREKGRPVSNTEGR
jgi:ribosomal protein S18 acetylase RimI-like enzyme